MENYISKVVSVCITCPEDKLDDPFKVLLTIEDTGKVSEILKSTLIKSRDPTTKQRVSSLIQKYVMDNSGKLNLQEEDLLNLIQVLTTETPQTTSKEYIEDFCKCIEHILSLIKNTSPSKLFNHIVSKPCPYSAISIALLTKEDNKYIAQALKFIIAVLNNPNPLAYYAAGLFFTFHQS